MRIAEKSRKTKETDIRIKINLDGKGGSSIDTGLPFLDHMFELFAKHSLIDLEISAKGDLDIDAHHTIEDLGIVFGTILKEAAGDKIGIKRYGWSYLPMDESLARVVVDFSGRPYLVYKVKTSTKEAGTINVRLFHEFFQALSVNAGMNLHIELLYGEEVHHIFEAIFKGFAKAISQALTIDKNIEGVLSTKGTLN
ncbi:MAG: imidazoleglycerol-phosphate dehydratase HisB [Verrucomicrobiota bacterium]|nr:imidazoleglycerol-phosphate dehydratase HisB [Verrucomicrobiota bacterium]